MAMFMAAAPTGAVAQHLPESTCWARARELSALTPRARADREALDARARLMVQDALECVQDTSAMLQRTVRLRWGTVHVSAQGPRVQFNSLGGLPDARDAGVMWSGRGNNVLVTGGGALDAGPFHAVVMPVFWASENRSFDFLIARDPARSSFASPFYEGSWSADWPSRFGQKPQRFLGRGDWGWWFTLPFVDAGISSSTQAWGPGSRAHLLLGGDAPGIPRLFVRTTRPIATRFGFVSGTAFRGTLTESPYFDQNPSNDQRQMWALAAEVSPSRYLQLGIAHASITLEKGSVGWEGMTTLSARVQSADDMGSAWLEVGSMGELPTLRDLLTVPTASLAYVLGFEKATAVGGATRVMVSAEVVNLEQPRAVFGESTSDYYTSGVVPQGWTQRGRMLGVSTGPGSQSQWVAVDLIRPHWSAGVFAERVRWNEDAFFREYLPYANRHDVTTLGGIRLGLQLLGFELEAQASSGRRLNYLFQNDTFIPEYRTVDVKVPQLRVSFARVPR
jgi:hypothetical protein